jgi:hypothetical protein
VEVTAMINQIKACEADEPDSARRMTPEQYTDALNRIEAFERGETTDLSGETPTVLFVSGLSNEEAGRRIAQITQDFVVNGGFDMRDFPGRK